MRKNLSPPKKSVRESLIEKFMACGWDMFIACEETDKVIAEFLASGKQKMTFGINTGTKKAMPVCIARK